ncbi:MAG: HAMP domain-containing protein [Bacteroidetes bacterium]|nr:MAG: HAMP domain-containing protein [Bacteroidota bacterium]
MKNPGIKGKNVCLACLLLGLIALLVLVVTPWQTRKRERPEEIRLRFESFLQEHENHIRKEVSGISSEFLTDSLTPLDPDQVATIPELNGQEMTIFIYQGDSLIYWSDNRVPFSRALLLHHDVTPELVRLENGWYELLVFRKGIFTIAGLCLVKQNYPFQNQYLRNHYIGSIRIPDEVKISPKEGQYTIYSTRGTFVCSLDIPGEMPPQKDQSWLIFFLISAYLLLSIFLYRLSLGVQEVFRNRYWLFFILLADILILRGLQFAFRWPETLYRSDLFGPVLYSSSWLFPSLGDFLINSFLILIIAFIFYRIWPEITTRNKPQYWGKALCPFLRFGVSLATLILVMTGLHSLVIHSTLAMNLENVSRLSWASVPAFASIGFLALGWILITLKLVLPKLPEDPAKAEEERKFPFSWFFLAMVLFAVCATVVLNRANTLREQNQRELLAMRLTARQNPVTELLLQQTVQAIKDDSSVGLILSRAVVEPDILVTDDSVSSYLLHQYFRDYWNNFNVQTTICRGSKILRIQPQGFEINCSAYFEEVISAYGKSCQEGIYFLDYGYGNENYIVRLPVPEREEVIYLEISSRSTYKDLGYPELLVDRSSYDFPDPGDYSYAFYQKNQLVHRVGEYIYGFELTGYVDTLSQTLLPSTDRMDHFLYRINDKESLIMSKPLPTWLNTISPFSYLLIFLLLFFAIGFSILNLNEITGLMMRSLRNRLQFSMLGMIITLFIITGVLMMVYLTWLNSKKNEENLMERTLSILIEVEHKFDRLNDLKDAGPEELETILIKFSNVFFSDINLYDPQGILLASSRPRIFREGLISDLINREAFNRLLGKKSSMFVQIEHIGELHYLSAYVPFYNTQNKLLGYLNLPYFSRQDDLRREISTFLVAFINIYVLFILLGVLVTYLVSTYITAPLKLLAQRIGRIRIGRTDDKLIWRREDEIGKLVEEYNRMLDELAISAEKLAVSERESAWREMAQQVAHEIKNPLTPMRLGVQHLQKAWDDRAVDWEFRLKRFSEALITQIDSLSAIASEFSYFARMPESENETLLLDDLVKSSLTMYKEVPSIQLEFDPAPAEKWVYADRRQLLRLFSNLLNNAVEAIEAKPGTSGKILVRTDTTKTEHIVQITDNGKGIRMDEADKIFQPNFTTRSGGAGLGLAIVKGILDSVGGAISFSSDPGKITTFTVRLPATKPSEQEKES